MRHSEEFESTIRLTRIALLISGIKLYNQKWHFLIDFLVQKVLFYLNIVTLYAVLIAEIYLLIEALQMGGTFVEHSLMTPCITISILGTVKVGFLFYKRDVLLQIIDKLSEIHPIFHNEVAENVLINEDKEIGNTEEKITKDSMRLLKRNMLVLIGSGVCVVTMFCLMPFILMMVGYIQEGAMKIQYPFLVKYFFDAYNIRLWYLEYIHQVYATAIVFLNVVGADTLLHAFCTFIEMHFKLLSFRIENIQATSKEETRNNFVKSVKRHQELIELVNKIEMVYNKSMLFNIVTSSVLICLSGFNMTVTESFNTRFTYFTFLMLSLSQIFLICYFADNLMQASTEVSKAIYKCKWYEIDKSTKKGVFLMLIRAQKPCKLTAANFADLNLNAFTTILSRSWSLFALLRTVYN